MPPGVYERTARACCGSKGARHKRGCAGAEAPKPVAKKKPAKRRTGGGKRSKKTSARRAAAEPSTDLVVTRNGHDVDGAKRLLVEKLDEQIVETRAELRVLERLRAQA